MHLSFNHRTQCPHVLEDVQGDTKISSASLETSDFNSLRSSVFTGNYRQQLSGWQSKPFLTYTQILAYPILTQCPHILYQDTKATDSEAYNLSISLE